MENHAMKNLLTCRALTLAQKNKLLCDDLHWQINAGETWAILGKNGAGKTTLLHSLANLHRPTKGTIHLNDSDITQLSRRVIAQNIGILLQQQHDAFPIKVHEMVMTGAYPQLTLFNRQQQKQFHDQALIALKKMDLLPLLNRCVTTLSGGERRRLAIATLLLQQPQVYLLDEPTNSLDIKHQVATLQHFRYLAEQQNAATIMVLHDVNLAYQFCDNCLLLMDDGRYLIGKTTDIINQENLLSVYQQAFMMIQQQNNTYWQAQCPN